MTRGQISRKMIRTEIERRLPQYLPNPISKVANLIAYDLNLSPFTVRYNYLSMLLDAGIIAFGDDGQIHLTEKGKQALTTEDGLTKEELKEEWEEENQKRKELGKEEISFTEWVKTRQATRRKPLGV